MRLVVGCVPDARPIRARATSCWEAFRVLAESEGRPTPHMLAEYRAGLHNFFDYRCVLPLRDPGRNVELEAASLAVAAAVQGWEAGEGDADDVEAAVRRVIGGIADLPACWSAALDEFLDTFAQPSLTAEEVARMPHFGPLFGRETIYLSFEKR